MFFKLLLFSLLKDEKTELVLNKLFITWRIGYLKHKNYKTHNFVETVTSGSVQLPLKFKNLVYISDLEKLYAQNMT